MLDDYFWNIAEKRFKNDPFSFDFSYWNDLESVMTDTHFENLEQVVALYKKHRLWKNPKLHAKGFIRALIKLQQKHNSLQVNKNTLCSC